jgi:protein TonB
MIAATPDTRAANDRLVVALLFAGAVHALVIFGITFSEAQREAPPRQVEVTLVQRAGERPELADLLAQADRTGSGDQSEIDRIARVTESMPRPATRPGEEGAGLQRFDERESRQITAQQSQQQIARQGRHSERLSGARVLPVQAASEARQAQETTVALEQTALSTEKRTRRITEAASLSSLDAAYLQDWRQRVESVGNSYYPEASLRYGIYGSLQMLVVIRRDGSLEDVRILSSSGQAVLDEAALRIVRQAAPYSPFPEALAATTDRLEIVRTWQFQQNPLSSD